MIENSLITIYVRLPDFFRRFFVIVDLIDAKISFDKLNFFHMHHFIILFLLFLHKHAKNKLAKKQDFKSMNSRIYPFCNTEHFKLCIKSY